LTIIVELEKGGTSFDLSLYQARCVDFQDVVSLVGFAERSQQFCAEAEDGRCRLSSDDEVTKIGLGRGIGFLT
jgi:hypothetical protein